jgi:hypothetical protein
MFSGIPQVVKQLWLGLSWLFNCETIVSRQRPKPEIRKVSTVDHRNRATTREHHNRLRQRVI